MAEVNEFGLTDAEMADPVDRVTAKLVLALAAGFDPRVEVGDGTALAWALALGRSGEGMRAGDAVWALVEFYRQPLPADQHRPRLDPGHLVGIVDAWREEWAGQMPMPVGGRAPKLVSGEEAARAAGLPMAQRVRAISAAVQRGDL